MTTEDKIRMLEEIEGLPEKDRRFIQGVVAGMVLRNEAQQTGKPDFVSENTKEEGAA